MECSEIGSLLSEFLDDALDPSTRGRVEEHISRCGACAAELAALRACIEAVRSLEKVSAPPNFLAGVHERIGTEQPRPFPERPSLWKRIAGRLLPSRGFKIPAELTGLVTASLLVVALYYAMQGGKDAAFIPSAPAPRQPIQQPSVEGPGGHPRTPEAPTSETQVSREGLKPEGLRSEESRSEGSRSEESRSTGSSPEEPGPAGPRPEKPGHGERKDAFASPRTSVAPPSRERRPEPESAPFFKALEKPPAGSPPPSVSSPAPEAAPVPGPRSSPGVSSVPSLSRSAVELTLLIAPPPPQSLREREQDRAAMPPQAMGDSTASPADEARKEAHLPAAPPASPSPTGAASEAFAPEPHRTVGERDRIAGGRMARIRQIVESAGGSVRKVESRKEGDMNAQSIEVRVPARNYALVLNELRSLGELREPPGERDAAPAGYGDDEPLPLRIRLVFPR